MNGVVRSVQKGTVQKSTLFDINLDIISVEFKTQEYEEVTISEEDEVRDTRGRRATPRCSSKIIASISPTIYGYESERRRRSRCSCSAACTRRWTTARR